MPSGAPREDWFLVRLPTGAAGWLLGSRTYSAIPIEVAQYAEGRRILSYFGLGPVVDSLTGESKETWLWVQGPRERQDYDFDRIRVFRWSNHRDAYQTIKGLAAAGAGSVHVAVCRARGRKDAAAFFDSLHTLVRRHVGVPLAWLGELERDDIAAGLREPLQTAARDAGAAFLRRVAGMGRALDAGRG